MRQAVLLGAAWALLWGAVYGQTLEEMEQSLEEQHEEETVLSVLELFERYRQEPLCLRRARVGELAQLPGISRGIASRLLQLVRQYPDTALAQLLDSLSLSPEQRQILLQATTMECPPRESPRATARAAASLPLASFGEMGGFLGPFFASRGRVRQRWEWLEFEGVWERDAGEALGMEHLSLSLIGQPWEGVRWIVGDFRCLAATGLMLGPPFRLRSAGMTAPAPWRTTLRPWASTLEEGYWRGAALQVDLGQLGRVLGWAAVTPRSGRVDSNGIVRSIKTDGIFATPQERQLRFAFREYNAGGVVELRLGEGLRWAVEALWLRYSHPLETQSRRDFRGQSGMLLGSGIAWHRGAWEFVAEGVRDAQGQLAGVAALRYSTKRWSAAVQLRSFAEEFRSPYGSAFSWYSAPSNEQGVYTAATWRMLPGVSAGVYGELFRSLAPPFRMPIRQYGGRVGGWVEWRKAQRWALRLWLLQQRTLEARRWESRWQSYEQERTAARLSTAVQLRQGWRLRGRVELLWGRVPESQWGALQLLGMEVVQERWGGSAWSGLYRTPGSTLAFWVYEGATQEFPRLHMLYGRGSYTALSGWVRLWKLRCEAAAAAIARTAPPLRSVWGRRLQGGQYWLVSLAVEVRY